MIAVVDYGVGNLFSLTSSLKAVGAPARVTADAEEISRANGIILPGVGAFGDARAKLDATGLVPVLKERAAAGVPLLGICLGMQLLFERSSEYGVHEGLGLLAGEVVPFRLPEGYKIPHMGWNSLRFLRPCPLLKYAAEGDYVYYVHSYHAAGCEGSLVAVSDYGVTVPGLVARGNIFGAQFHPEKSGSVGLGMLRAFAELCAGGEAGA